MATVMTMVMTTHRMSRAFNHSGLERNGVSSDKATRGSFRYAFLCCTEPAYCPIVVAVEDFESPVTGADMNRNDANVNRMMAAAFR